MVAIVFFCSLVTLFDATLDPLDIMSMNEMFPMTNDFLYTTPHIILSRHIFLSRLVWLEYVASKSGI